MGTPLYARKTKPHPIPPHCKKRANLVSTSFTSELTFDGFSQQFIAVIAEIPELLDDN